MPRSEGRDQGRLRNPGGRGGHVPRGEARGQAGEDEAGDCRGARPSRADEASPMAMSSVLAVLSSPIVLGTFGFVLVAIGSWMVLRDVIRDRRQLKSLFDKGAANSLRSAPASVPMQTQRAPVEIAPLSVSAGTSDVPVPAPPETAAPQSFQQLAKAIAEIRSESSADEQIGAGERDPSMEASWKALAARVDRVIRDAEPVIAAVRVSVAAPGEPRWGLSHHSFGPYRRLNLAGDSIGWLRSEITRDGRLRFRVRAHQPQLALLNAESACDLARLTTSELARALTIALLPLTRYAAWTETQSVPNDAVSSPLDQLVGQATAIANSALVEAHASFRPHLNQSEAPGSLPRVVLDVLVDDQQVALMHVDRIERTLDVSVGVPDPSRLDLARRQTLPVDQAAAYELAEAMTVCAWPALANALGRLSGSAERAPDRLPSEPPFRVSTHDI